MFSIQPSLCSLYICHALCKSTGSKSPGEGEAVKQEPCLFNVGCERNGYSVPGQKEPSLSLSLDPQMQSVALGTSANNR